MIYDEGKRLISEEIPNKSLLVRIQISLKGDLLYPGCSQIKTDKSLVYTSGFYWVKYKPGGSFAGLTKLYSLCIDLFWERRKFIRVRDWDELVEMGKTEPRVAWILKYTNISKEHFDIATQNKYAPIVFALDIVKYNKMLQEKAKSAYGKIPEEGLLVDPLLVLAEHERVKSYHVRKKELRQIIRENKKK